MSEKKDLHVLLKAARNHSTQKYWHKNFAFGWLDETDDNPKTYLVNVGQGIETFNSLEEVVDYVYGQLR